MHHRETAKCTAHIQQRHRQHFCWSLLLNCSCIWIVAHQLAILIRNRGKTGYFYIDNLIICSQAVKQRLIKMRAAGQRNTSQNSVREFVITQWQKNYRNLDFGRLCLGPCAAWKILRSGIHSKIHQWRHQTSQYAKYVDGTRLHRLLFIICPLHSRSFCACHRITRGAGSLELGVQRNRTTFSLRRLEFLLRWYSRRYWFGFCSISSRPRLFSF